MIAKKEMIHRLTMSARILRNTSHRNIERKIDNVKHIGDDDGKPMETSEFHDMTIGIDISVDAVNEYAKSILGRYPKNNYEFSRALAMKILEETKSLANSEEKE